MNPLTKAQIIAQLSDFIMATLRECTRNPRKRWMLFQEIAGILRYAKTLDHDVYLQVLEEVYLLADLDTEEVWGVWQAYNA